MRNTTINFKKAISAVTAAALTVIPFGAFAENKNVVVKSYVYTANCSADTTIDIDNIFTEIKDNLGGIHVIFPPQTDSENNNGNGSIDTEIQKPETDTENNTNNGIGNDAQTNTLSEYERRVVELVNEIRIKNGLNALAINNELSAVARLKSQDMKDNNYFSHTSPTYGSPFDMMKQFGISYRTAGENIARGQRTPEAVVNGWMNSEGHRANILNSAYTQMGVGYVADGNYWTQMFIG